MLTRVTTTTLTRAMAGVLERMARAQRTPLYRMSPQQARAAYEAGAEVLDLPRAKLARVADVEVPARDGAALRARLYAPSHEPLPLLLFLHGGGFVLGSLETHDSLCRQLALRSGAAVLALDYRRAPEFRFPTAVDDTWDALAWLASAPRFGLDPTRIAVGGDSAGGTLAAVAALHARDIGLELRLQLLVTPGTAADADSESHRRYASGHLLESDHIEYFFDHYIDRAERRDWRFAPLLADDVDGVAPACVILAEADPLVDEGIAYADRLRAAGVAVELELVRGVTHDFIKLGRAVPEAVFAQRVAADAVRKAFER
jgi:acetyl esterase